MSKRLKIVKSKLQKTKSVDDSSKRLVYKLEVSARLGREIIQCNATVKKSSEVISRNSYKN